MPEPRVAVIGGGCAGLAAASRLAENRIRVTLFEAAPRLGGRARGFDWKNHRLDNGQHILLGAYRETLRLLALAGVDENRAFMRIPLKLTMHDEFELSACRFLPAPLHILAGLMLARGLSPSERIAAVRFMAWMKLHGFKLPQDEPLAGILSRQRQPARVTKLLWEPICLAALNTPLKDASAQVFLNVLRDSFSRSKADSDMLLPRSDFTTLMADPLAGYVKQAGGDVRTRSAVSRISRAGNGFTVKTDGGEEGYFSHVVMAVPPFRLSELLAHLPGAATEPGAQFSYQPIYTIYLQYPQTIRLPSAMTGFATGYSQWVFDRGRLYGQPGLLSVVISAEGRHQQMTQENLARQVADELARAFPFLPEPSWHKVIAEKRATFACTAGMQRPAQETTLPGLYLAGDYTAGDYPATIEGAARSGVICAEKIISASSIKSP